MSLVQRVLGRGTCFGNWNIIRHLSSGAGSSAVFEIVRKTGAGEERCALKVVCVAEEDGRLEDWSEDYRTSYLRRLGDAKRRAVGEARLMHALRGCPNVVKYFESGAVEWEDESGFGCDLYIRMELLMPLSECERILDRKQIAAFGADVLTALEHSHSRGIIHRDVKPANIFRDSAGRYKLGDFGIARIGEAGLNHAKTARGTPAYAAPEQFLRAGDGGYDERVDIYSLGLVLYELLNDGLLPFAGSPEPSIEEIRPRLAGKPLPKPKNADGELWDIIRRACAFDPEQRFSSAREMRLALEEAEKHKKRRARSNALRLTAAAAALAALAPALWFALRRPAPTAPDAVDAENAAVPPAVTQTARASAAPTEPPEPAASEDLPELSGLVVGDTAAFGRFERDGIRENGAEALQWYVISVSEDSALLLSRSIVRLLPPDEAGVNEAFAGSENYRWLNGEFYDGAFSEAEKRLIVPQPGGRVTLAFAGDFSGFIEATGINWNGRALTIPAPVAAERGVDPDAAYRHCLLFSDEEGRTVCCLLDYGGSFMELTPQVGGETIMDRIGTVGICPCVLVRTSGGQGGE